MRYQHCSVHPSVYLWIAEKRWSLTGVSSFSFSPLQQGENSVERDTMLHTVQCSYLLFRLLRQTVTFGGNIFLRQGTVILFNHVHTLNSLYKFSYSSSYPTAEIHPEDHNHATLRWRRTSHRSAHLKTNSFLTPRDAAYPQATWHDRRRL